MSATDEAALRLQRATGEFIDKAARTVGPGWSDPPILPGIYARDIQAILGERDALLAWKAEAMAVLARWDRVAALVPGMPLGAVVSDATCEYVKGLQVCVEAMRAQINDRDMDPSEASIQRSLDLMRAEDRALAALDALTGASKWEVVNRDDVCGAPVEGGVYCCLPKQHDGRHGE